MEGTSHLKITIMTFYWPVIYFVILCVILFSIRKNKNPKQNKNLDRFKPEPFFTTGKVALSHLQNWSQRVSK